MSASPDSYKVIYRLLYIVSGWTVLITENYLCTYNNYYVACLCGYYITHDGSMYINGAIVSLLCEISKNSLQSSQNILTRKVHCKNRGKNLFCFKTPAVVEGLDFRYFSPPDTAYVYYTCYIYHKIMKYIEL